MPKQHFRVYTPTPSRCYAVSMTKQNSKNGRQDEAVSYEIGLQGQIDSKWSAWFAAMQVVRQEDGTTLLIGSLADQAALFGVLKRVRDAGIPLLSVNQVKRLNEEKS